MVIVLIEKEITENLGGIKYRGRTRESFDSSTGKRILKKKLFYNNPTKSAHRHYEHFPSLEGSFHV